MSSVLSGIAWILLIVLLVPFPIGTDRRMRRFPYVTASLVALNVAAFLITQHQLDMAASSLDTPWERWGLKPNQPHIVDFVTYMFVHESVSHLLWNLAFLWLFAPNVEDAVGPWLFGALYLGGGIAAGLLHTAVVATFAGSTVAASTPIFGASGAIAAILGIFAVRFYRAKMRLCWVPGALLDKRGGIWEAPALIALGLWIAQNIFSAVASLFSPDRAGIAYWAHIGGFVFGAVCAQVLDLLGEGKREYLMRDAQSALASGAEGSVFDAIRSYRLALQRRPHDDEPRYALAGLARQYKQASDVRAALDREYGLLIDHAVMRDRYEQALVWIEDTRMLHIEPTLPAKSLAALATYLAASGRDSEASAIYRRVAEKFPNSDESARALLDLATLALKHRKTSAATGTLREFLAEQADHAASNKPIGTQ